MLFKMAGFAYITVFFNINPLPLDGYYLLTDAVDITSLRERSMSFVRQRLARKLTKLKDRAMAYLHCLWSALRCYGPCMRSTPRSSSGNREESVRTMMTAAFHC
jgi:hypothetical protein